MKIEIPLSWLLKINKKRRYKPGSVLYSLKTGKLYGGVMLSNVGDRGCEYVFIIRPDGTTYSKTSTYLDKTVKIEEDEEKYKDLYKKAIETTRNRINKLKKSGR